MCCLGIVKKDSRLRVFQYKLLNNVLYLKKMLFRFGKIDSPPCSFSKMIDKTPLHLFYNCTKTKLFRDQLKNLCLTQYAFSLLRHRVPSQAILAKLSNMNPKKDLSILRNGVLSLTILFKRCNERKGIRGRIEYIHFYCFIIIFIIVISHLFAFVFVFLLLFIYLFIFFFVF